MSTERKRSVSMQRWSREAGSWVDDMGVLRIDVDAHADWPLARLARSLLPVIPAKAGTQCLRCFEEQSRWVPAFAGMTALPDGHDRRESRPWPLPLGAGVMRCRRAPRRRFPEIGSASCRESVCQYVSKSVGAETLQKKK